MTSHGLLFLRVRTSDAGVYVCQTVEHGYVHTLLRISLHVLRGERVESAIHRPNDAGAEKAVAVCHSPVGRPPRPSISPRALLPSSVPGPHSRLWYKEFLQLIGYGNAQRVEEYCERVWCSDKKRKKTKRKYVPTGEKRGKGKVDENSHRAPRHTLDTWGEQHWLHTLEHTHTFVIKVRLTVPCKRFSFCFEQEQQHLKKNNNIVAGCLGFVATFIIQRFDCHVFLSFSKDNILPFSWDKLIICRKPDANAKNVRISAEQRLFEETKNRLSCVASDPKRQNIIYQLPWNDPVQLSWQSKRTHRDCCAKTSAPPLNTTNSHRVRQERTQICWREKAFWSLLVTMITYNLFSRSLRWVL